MNFDTPFEVSRGSQQGLPLGGQSLMLHAIIRDTLTPEDCRNDHLPADCGQHKPVVFEVDSQHLFLLCTSEKGGIPLPLISREWRQL